MIEIYVCVGSSCHLKGSYSIIEELKRLVAIEKTGNKIELKARFCTSNCVNGVCIEINGDKIQNVTPQNVEKIFYEKVTPLLITNS